MEPTKEIPSSPPTAIAELLSPANRHGEFMRKLREHRDWGVQQIWVIDPGERTLGVLNEQGLVGGDRLALPGFEISTPPGDLFE